MFRIERRKREEFPDVRGFADLVREGAGGYTHATEIFVARAPGRPVLASRRTGRC